MRKEKDVLKVNNEENIRRTCGSLYYYMRYLLIQYEKYTRHSSYESRYEANLTCVQVMLYMRQIFVKHKVVIIM